MNAPVPAEAASTTSDVVALVDVDNVTGVRARTRQDARQMLFDVARNVEPAVVAAFPAATGVVVRLYGGWADSSGRDAAAVNIVPEMAEAARLWRSTRRGRGPSQVFRLVDRPEGSPVRAMPFVQDEVRPCCNATVPGQKLVDTTLSADTAAYGPRLGSGLIVMSSDRDMLPGLLVASALRSAAGGRPQEMLVWHRPTTPLRPHEQALSSLMRLAV